MLWRATGNKSERYGTSWVTTSGKKKGSMDCPGCSEAKGARGSIEEGRGTHGGGQARSSSSKVGSSRSWRESRAENEELRVRMRAMEEQLARLLCASQSSQPSVTSVVQPPSSQPSKVQPPSGL